MKIIKFSKTVLGWYNFSFAIYKYNIKPETFREITRVSEEATLGICEVTAEELEELRARATFIGFADGWKLIGA